MHHQKEILMPVLAFYSLSQLGRFADRDYRSIKTMLAHYDVPTHPLGNGKATIVYLSDIKACMPDLYKSLLLTTLIKDANNEAV